MQINRHLGKSIGIKIKIHKNTAKKGTTLQTRMLIYRHQDKGTQENRKIRYNLTNKNTNPYASR